MSKIQPDKVATINEVKSRVATTTTAVVTEYRGLTVAQISTLRRQLRTLGADYKVFKNTLVRRAIAGTSVESLSEFLVGPTAIAFIDGDVSAVAKALRDFARESPKLIVKGGVMDGKSLTTKDLGALADLPSRDVMLAQLAGLLASPLRTMAGLLKAVPQNFAYGLSALLESKGGVAVPDEKADEVAETPVRVDDAGSPVSDDAAPVAETETETETPVEDAAVKETPVAETETETEAPGEDAADKVATVAETETEAEAPGEDAAAKVAPVAETETEAEAPVEDAATEPGE